MAFGLLQGFEPADRMQLGLLGLGGLGQVFGAAQPRYSTNIAQVSGPNTMGSDWLPAAGAQLGRIRRDAALAQQMKGLEELRQMQIERARKDAAAEDELGRAIAGAGGNFGDPGVQSVVQRRYPAQAMQLWQQDQANKNRLQSFAPGSAIYQGGTQVGSVPDRPQYKERDFAISPEKIQKQFSMDGGMTWQNAGQPYDRRDPFLVFDRTTPGGGQERVAVPRPSAAVPGANLTPGGAIPLGATKEPGAPEGVSAEAAGRLALITEGEQAVDTLRARIFKNGKVDRGVLASAAIRVPGTEGQQIRNLFRNAIGNRIRIESGANITEAEMNNMLSRYMPGPMDNEATIKQKLDGLSKFFADFKSVSKGSDKLPSGGFKVLSVD